ncbi:MULTISPECIES: hypothetical protein [unclassified Ruegeria]|uniref:hypothetical protein n=1 Tax=unclassified Ruegeria TaxID=2625375 RepID=UPI001AE7166C|nr:MULTISPECIES: hypothetical protein [unclassified Ruegeria]
MVNGKNKSLGAVLTAPVFGIVVAGSAVAAPETCNWKTARNLANAGDYAGLCDCVQVTPSFLDRLQKRPDFETTLSIAGAQCPGLAALLTDLPTASLTGAAENRGESRSSEPGGAGFANAVGPDGLGGGGEPDNGGQEPGGGGGEPSGGGEPGGGGGEPGGGRGESGGGDGEPGGGKGNNGGGKGHNGGGKGGDKGNNGGGNGGEGSSPGRGNNANDDEGESDRPGRGKGRQ